MSQSPKGLPVRSRDFLDRGRYAASPLQIPLNGWRDILLRVKHEARRDNLSLVAAGMAFWALLSVAPALALLVSIYGLLITPEALADQFEQVTGYLPPAAETLLFGQLKDLAEIDYGALGFGIFLSAALSLYGASKATTALFAALNAVYDEIEQRSYWHRTLQSLLFTFGALILFVVMLLSLAIIPSVLAYLNLSMLELGMLRVGSLFVVAVSMVLALAVAYRYGPSRRQARWRWVSTGALFAFVMWGIASVVLSWYAQRFGTYQETYGALGAVVVLLMWFYLSAYAVLLGGELNAELEHQTELDTTVGEDRPRGERGAVMADNVGPIPSWSRLYPDQPEPGVVTVPRSLADDLAETSA
ncbi:MAG: YihY/virulence factor BrkB family protein [Pseudomonadota bacterium]